MFNTEILFFLPSRNYIYITSQKSPLDASSVNGADQEHIRGFERLG